jgi:hypothetical protein
MAGVLLILLNPQSYLYIVTSVTTAVVSYKRLSKAHLKICSLNIGLQSIEYMWKIYLWKTYR